MKYRKDAGEVTREALEGFIWAATGWRGDASVIDSILGRVDDYTTAQCARTLMGEMPVVDTSHLDAQISELRDQVGEEREAKEHALATVTELTRRLTAVEQERAQTPPAPAPLAPIVDRIHVGELLDLLTTATNEATAGLNAAAHTVDAISAISNALRAADGMAKDIELSASPGPHEAHTAPVDIPPALERQHRVQEAQERYAERRARIDALTAKVEAEALENDGESVISLESLAVAELITDEVLLTATAEEVRPELDEDCDPIAALVLEVEAEIAAESAEKHCKACDTFKTRDRFYRDKSAPDGLMYSCKDCNAQRARDRDAAQRAAKEQAPAA